MPSELLATPPSPSLDLVAHNFLGMAFQHDYLSTGRGHHLSHKVITGRNQTLKLVNGAPSLRSPPEPGASPGTATQPPPRSFTDAEEQYLAHVASLPRISSAEEYDLAKRMKKGDIQARNALIQANLGLVVMFARQHFRPGLSLLDLIADGNLGLFASADRFDPEMGFRFATYAKWWVLNGIRSSLKRDNKSLGMMDSTSANDTSANDAADSTPSDWQRITLGEPETATAGQAEGHKEAIDCEDEPAQLTQLKQRSILLRRALERLSKRECAIVSARYALTGEDEQTLTILADRFNLSVERVRQIEQAALQKLAQALGKLGVSADCLF